MLMFRAKASSKGLAFHSQLPAEDIWVKGDTFRFKQILTNLLSNAIKFTQKGEIKLILRHILERGNSRVKLEIIDTGVGLSQEELPRLFGRLSQADSSRSQHYEGSRLGLSISKKLALMMGGDISVTSKKGNGSSFTVAVTFDALTLKEQQGLLMTEWKERAERVHSFNQIPLAPTLFAQKNTRKTKVLIVDDSTINQKVLSMHLQKAGYECSFAIDGSEGLAAYNKGNFDIVLTDIVMPQMDGIALIKAIRQQEKEKDPSHRIPIIAISANALQDDKEKALAAGADDYAIKPVTREELYQKVSSLLKSPPAQSLISSSSLSSSSAGL